MFCKKIVLLLMLVGCTTQAIADDILLYSPDKKTKLVVAVQDKASYSVFYNDKIIVLPSYISMALGNGVVLGHNIQLLSAKTKAVNEKIYPVLKEKRAVVPDVYNELVLLCKGNYSIQFRAYDDGVAYRFVTTIKDSVKVMNEEAEFNFDSSSVVWYAPVTKRADADIFHTSFEGFYQSSSIDTLNTSHVFFSPVLITINDAVKAIITESDIIDYPGMFLQGNNNKGLKASFAAYPAEEEIVGGDGFRQAIVTKRKEYIAPTKGNRSFPWRIIGISSNDASILTNDIVYRLASPSTITNTSWIKPGKSTEEWITDVNLYGVDFKTGINTATYKYYVDFAAKFGLDYVMLDAGWSDVNDLFRITAGMDVKEVIRYAATKNIGIILWTQGATLKRQMNAALDSFKTWGVKIVMTDFIDRDDQQANNFLYQFADEAAKRELMVMIHGAPKPAGFSRTHPNALTREAAAGSEYNAWSDKMNPTHDMQLAFIRMFSGTMDYEPGLLQNATQKHKEKLGMEKVIAQGTVIHQMAMFVVYESPLQLFSGNISDALKEPELMKLWGTIPTVWDETKIIQARYPEYIVEARRNGNEWFIGAMNDWTAKDLDIATDFLGYGDYIISIARDGINADRNAQDYKLETKLIHKGENIHIHLAPGGGYVAKITRPVPKQNTN